MSVAAEVSRIRERIDDLLGPAGFEAHAFKIGWYNDVVQTPFQFKLSRDTVAFIIISTPAMFEKAFVPFMSKSDCLGPRDPIDECVADQFRVVKQNFSEYEIESIHDFELLPSRRPRVLVQSAGHVAGAAYYYRRQDVKNDPWGDTKKIFGVSVHPKYGGWFALRGVLIFRNLECSDLPQPSPPDCVPEDEKRIELLERFNGNWQDWTYRDIIPPAARYSEQQKLYFATLPADRKQFIQGLKKGEAENDSHPD